MSDHLHTALKTSVVGDVSDGGVNYRLVRNQNGKDDFIDVLHANPNTYSHSGIQTTDFLHFLGFSRSACAFHVIGECYCKKIPLNTNGVVIAKAISAAYQKFQEASRVLQNCGIFINQPEGLGYFFRKPSGGRDFRPYLPNGNGHVASKIDRMKVSEDEYFNYVFTWIESPGGRGWTTHYRAKHMPMSPEFQSALDFLGGFSVFENCPEFEFDSCWWRFYPFQEEREEGFYRSADSAHRLFDSHANNFSSGLKLLLESHAELEPAGFTFLPMKSFPIQPAPTYVSKPSTESSKKEPVIKRDYKYDVAITFAGTERPQAEELATRVRDAGFAVFYDGFYPQQLWGKDLAAYFDRVYRKDSKYCVMFVSKEYAERMWTSHERRSAQARAVQEKGNEYILPIRVDETDLDGLPNSVGYLSLSEYSIENISKLLLKKIKD